MSKKRQANLPIVGKSKEKKGDMSEAGLINGEGDVLGMSQDLYRTAVSQESTVPSKPIFTTKKPDGAF
jgi:hypothetical protein